MTSHSHTATGLNELVPDNLLGIFDENELEVFLYQDSACLSCYVVASRHTAVDVWDRDSEL